MIGFLKREVHIFFTALMFYTRLPCPKWVDHSEEYLNKATKYFALIGWIVGGISALVFWGASFILPQAVALILSMIASVWVTGAFHEDGFADVCDGFGGGWKKEKILAIMKDSQSGAFAIVGLILLLLLKFESLNYLDKNIIPFALIAGHSLSRFMASIFIYTLPYVREDQLSKVKPIAKGIKLYELLLNAFFGLLPLILLRDLKIMLVFIPLVLAYLYLKSFYKKWIGGYTGDCLGAAQQVMEVIFYLGVLALSIKL